MYIDRQFLTTIANTLVIRRFSRRMQFTQVKGAFPRPPLAKEVWRSVHETQRPLEWRSTLHLDFVKSRGALE